LQHYLKLEKNEEKMEKNFFVLCITFNNVHALDKK